MTSLYALVVTSLHAGNFFMTFCSLKIFFKINVFKTSYQKKYQSVKHFGSKSGPTQCRACED